MMDHKPESRLLDAKALYISTALLLSPPIHILSLSRSQLRTSWRKSSQVSHLVGFMHLNNMPMRLTKEAPTARRQEAVRK